MASLTRQLVSLCSSINTRAILTKQPQRFLAIQNIRFTSASAEISKDELWEIKNKMIFRTIDHNGDNVVSQEDFKLMAEDYKKSGKYRHEDITAFTNKCSHNAALMGLSLGIEWSLEEWSKARKYHMLNPEYVSGLKVMFDKLFTMVDKDRKGYLSMDDWEDMAEILHINSREEVKSGFDAIDANKDGKLSREEFTDYMFEFYCTTDNELGTINMLGPLPK